MGLDVRKSDFVIRSLESILVKLAPFKISIIYVFEQAGFSLTWPETRKTAFYQLILVLTGLLCLDLIKVVYLTALFEWHR